MEKKVVIIVMGLYRIMEKNMEITIMGFRV